MFSLIIKTQLQNSKPLKQCNNQILSIYIEYKKLNALPIVTSSNVNASSLLIRLFILVMYMLFNPAFIELFIILKSPFTGYNLGASQDPGLSGLSGLSLLSHHNRPSLHTSYSHPIVYLSNCQSNNSITLSITNFNSSARPTIIPCSRATACNLSISIWVFVYSES